MSASFWISLFTFAANFVLLIILLVRYYTGQDSAAPRSGRTDGPAE